MVVYDKIEAGKRLTEVISDSGLNSRRFAKRLNLDPSYLSKMESGKTGISKTNLDAIEKEFAVSSHWLLFGKGPKKNGQNSPRETKDENQMQETAVEYRKLPSSDPMMIIANLTQNIQSLIDQQKEIVNNNTELVRTNRDLANKVINSGETGSTSLPSGGGRKVRHNPVQQTDSLDKPKIHSPRKQVKRKGIVSGKGS